MQNKEINSPDNVQLLFCNMKTVLGSVPCLTCESSKTAAI